jgi:hypothetical protein
MTSGERKILVRGISAGTLIGLAIGGMIAIVIAAGLIQ